MTVLDYDSDIDPDDLLPTYIESKTKLFEKDKSSIQVESRKLNGKPAREKDPETAKLIRKIKRIEDDVLFDQYIADQQWESKRIQLERLAAVERATVAQESVINGNGEGKGGVDDSDDEVSREAAKMGAAFLEEDGSDDDAALADLFASLPVNEVDPVSGKSSTVINGSDGTKVFIRDFGKWSSVSPQRILEEACRSRDPSAKLSYTTISDSSFAYRQSLRIVWAKNQDTLTSSPPSEVDFVSSPKQQTLSMISVATPDSKQSEAYIATIALFLIFGSSSREDKVFLRLPPAFRDLWMELAEMKKEKLDSIDREAIRTFRDMVRAKRDQEEEDGVLIQGAFRNRGPVRASDNVEAGQSKDSKISLNPEAYQRIWHEKYSTPSYQMMLVSFRLRYPQTSSY